MEKTVNDFDIQGIEVIQKLASEAGYNLRVKTVDGHKWVVLSDVELTPEIGLFLTSLEKFQQTILPDNVYGRCKDVHTLACANGLADGTLERTNEKGDRSKSIFLSQDNHVTAYKDLGKISCVIDLSAKEYIFTNPATLNYEAEGLVIISKPGNMKATEHLYQSTWTKHPYDKSRSEIDKKIIGSYLVKGNATPMDSFY